MTDALAAFGKGHEFAPISFELTEDWVAAYVAAVEDSAIVSHDRVVPPMALATLGVRTLLESAGLPQGAVHVGQELSFARAVRVGEKLAAQATIISRGERAGWLLMSLDLSISDTGARDVMTGRATLTFPAEEAA